MSNLWERTSTHRPASSRRVCGDAWQDLGEGDAQGNRRSAEGPEGLGCPDMILETSFILDLSGERPEAVNNGREPTYLPTQVPYELWEGVAAPSALSAHGRWTTPPDPSGHAAVIVPKSPSDSSFGPAVKNSLSIGPSLTVPCPNCDAQSPSMTSFRPSAVRSDPMSSKVPSDVSWYAFTWPSPKLPTIRSPPNRPKLAGASARPHGAFNWPCCATRTSRFPSVSKASTKPRPWPWSSSLAPGPCFAYVTKIRAPIV